MQPTADDHQLVDFLPLDEGATDVDTALRPIDSVGLGMPPIERPIPLDQREHADGIHAVALPERPLLHVRHDGFEEDGGGFLIGADGLQEGYVRARRQFLLP